MPGRAHHVRRATRLATAHTGGTPGSAHDAKIRSEKRSETRIVTRDNVRARAACVFRERVSPKKESWESG
jgi:hypothetical protein